MNNNSKKKMGTNDILLITNMEIVGVHFTIKGDPKTEAKLKWDDVEREGGGGLSLSACNLKASCLIMFPVLQF